MSINKNNYETYLIDYLDGKLTPVQVSEVLLFLEQYPEIKREFEGLDSVKDIEQSPVTFDTSFLKKPAYHEVKDEYEHLLVGELEGDLSKAEQMDLGRAKQLYPELNGDAALFAKTKTVPEKIPFPYKNDLKKHIIIPLYQQTWVRIAAVLLLMGFAGLVWMNFNSVEISGNQTAMVKPNNVNASEAPLSLGNVIIEKNGSTVTKTEKSANKYARSKSIIASKEGKIIQQHTEPLLIASITPLITQPSIDLNAEGLSFTDQYLKYTVPVKNEEYTDLRQLAVQQLGKQKEHLLGKNEEGKTLTFLQAINKATGDNIKVDTNGHGRIKRFEIAGLGFEWSQSK
jgi:hypothetical protein